MPPATHRGEPRGGSSTPRSRPPRKQCAHKPCGPTTSPAPRPPHAAQRVTGGHGDSMRPGASPALLALSAPELRFTFAQKWHMPVSGSTVPIPVSPQTTHARTAPAAAAASRRLQWAQRPCASTKPTPLPPQDPHVDSSIKSDESDAATPILSPATRPGHHVSSVSCDSSSSSTLPRWRHQDLVPSRLAAAVRFGTRCGTHRNETSRRQ